MVQGKKEGVKKSRRKMAVRKESLKDLSVKDLQKVKGGAVPCSYGQGNNYSSGCYNK